MGRELELEALEFDREVEELELEVGRELELEELELEVGRELELEELELEGGRELAGEVLLQIRLAVLLDPEVAIAVVFAHLPLELAEG